MFVQSIIYGNPDYYPPMINGAEILHRHGFHQEILSRRFRSAVFLIDDMDKYYPASTVIFRLDSSGKSTARAFLSFAWHVLRKSNNEADLFIGYNVHGFALARLLAYLYRKPVVYHSHDFMENNRVSTLGDRIFKTIERRFARTADLVIVPDRRRAAAMSNQLSLKKSPLIVANSSLTAPDAPAPELNFALQNLNISFEHIVFRPGTIAHGHSIDITIRSIPLWENKNWGFVVMGPCDQEYKVRLQILAEEFGVKDQFVILPPVNYAEVLKYTKGASLGNAIYEPININHQYSTTASNKIMEYIAAGIPMLLNDSAGNIDLINKYQNGLTVSHDSPEAIAQAVNLILGDPKLAQQMSEGSKRAFREEFNYETQYLPAIQRFKELARSRK